MSELFSRFAKAMSGAAGHPATFLAAAMLIVAWLAAGRVYDYQEGWQLFINTATTIITFLMVFLIQHTQNHDTAALQLKLDELLRATQDADNALVDLEQCSDEELLRMKERYAQLAERTKLLAQQKGINGGKRTTDRR
jgi:low affinity Fe/Cu permease